MTTPSKTPQTDAVFKSLVQQLPGSGLQAIAMVLKHARQLEEDRDRLDRRLTAVVEAAESVGWDGVNTPKHLTEFIKQLAMNQYSSEDPDPGSGRRLLLLLIVLGLTWILPWAILWYVCYHRHP